jgi:Rieske 2Fe-2S family protein
MRSTIEGPGYFTSLPGDYYASDEIFALELDRVIPRMWMFAGHISQIPQPGAFMVRQFGPETLIIIRGDDNEVRAFFNVCRHRGTQLCDPGERGEVKRIVCPYHRWSYGLDGKLRNAPGARNGADFDFEDFPLAQAECQQFHGALFVRLSSGERDKPFSEVVDTRNEATLRRVDPERTKVAHERVYPIDANWKLVLENNLECHHCASTHPELGVVCNFRGWFVDRDEVTANPEGDHFEIQEAVLFPFKKGVKTLSLDGEWVCQRPLGVGFHEGFSTGYVLLPSFVAVAYLADHGMAQAVIPVSTEKSLLLHQWYVHEDAVEGVDYDLNQLIGLFDATNVEDVAIVERVQRGVRSHHYVPGPHSPTREDGLKQGLATYLEMLDASDAVSLR